MLLSWHVKETASAAQVQPPLRIPVGGGRLTRDREETKAAFYHGYRSYLDNGFPADELRPLSCIGRGSDKLNPYPTPLMLSRTVTDPCRMNIGINDVCGDYSLTLIDTLDALAVFFLAHGVFLVTRRLWATTKNSREL